jgi:hypothetical protein
MLDNERSPGHVPPGLTQFHRVAECQMKSMSDHRGTQGGTFEVYPAHGGA